MTTYRVGIVGLTGIAIAPAASEPRFFGGVHPHSHAACYAALPQTEVVAVCDLVPALFDQFDRHWGPTWPTVARYTDYREVDEPFDRIVSVGMFEHVGRRYHQDFFASCERCLKRSGLVLLHTVGFLKEEGANPWFDKYILPGVEFPTVPNIVNAAGTELVLENFHCWEGTHYDKTLMSWFDRFDAGWDRIKEKYSEPFYRMWKLYLQGCAGAFRVERMRVWQLVFSKGGVPGSCSYSHLPVD